MLSATSTKVAAIRISDGLVSMNRFAKVGLMLATDVALLPFCSMIALLLRVGDVELAMQYGLLPHVFIMLITVPLFVMTSLYGAIIRFIDVRLLMVAGLGLAAAVACAFVLASHIGGRELPRGALVIYWFVAFSYVVTSRLVARLVLRGGRNSKLEEGCRTAIYGAGEAGAKLAIAMRVSDHFRPICFFDDKRSLENHNVAGLTVFHSDEISKTVSQRRIGLIVIAAPSATPEQRRAVMERARKSSAQVKILCNLMELTDEPISIRSIRDIKIEDLLGRQPIQPDRTLFEKCVRQQSVLVTGAGGSIGSELCRQIMTLEPEELHLLDHAEFSLYAIDQQLRTRFPSIRVIPHLGSVCDERLVRRIVGDNHIDTIYHAAAYKHVPIVEDNIAEGVRNNVLGASVIVNAARAYHVKTCVLISTDKAVRPTSVMGATKRVAELIFQAADREAGSRTKFCAVRFGNVLGSSGSVVPLFRHQIERGGPITITHPEVVRYFMSIPEAAQLVMQAGSMATGGDVFVMDMGQQVKIVDLARTMLAMCGLKERTAQNPDGDIAIEYIGLRPGEKLYEEMFAGNDAIPSRHPRIMTTTEYLVEPAMLAQQVAYLMVACSTDDKAMIRFLLQKLVAGYLPAPVDEAVPEPVDSFRYATPIKRGGLRLADRSL
jgi:FlaA1/EpsC-like NDP-sugar epimerase